jgi:hypothetical protein
MRILFLVNDVTSPPGVLLEEALARGRRARSGSFITASAIRRCRSTACLRPTRRMTRSS